MHTRISRSIIAIAMVSIAIAACSRPGSKRPGGAPIPAFRVVVVTPSESTAPREYRGAEALARSYPAKAKAGEIRHVVLPDKTEGSREAAVAAFIAAAADDPLVKAILVDPAIPGSAEGLHRIKDARGEDAKAGVFRIAGGSREESLVIEAAADLVVDLDRVYRAYLIPWEAKKMGASALLSAYARDEAADTASARERAIMSAACAELGLKFTVIDSPAGTDAVAYARSMSGAWLREHGRDTALYCSDSALAEPLIAAAIAGGGMIVDVAASATREAYAFALGLDLSPAKADAKKERRLIEAAIAGEGGLGRFGLWDADYAEASVEGLGELAMRIAEGRSSGDELKDLLSALGSRAPEAPWLAAYDVDPETGVKSANRILLREDGYIFGSGYSQTALASVPSKYLSLRGSGD